MAFNAISYAHQVKPRRFVCCPVLTFSILPVVRLDYGKIRKRISELSARLAELIHAGENSKGWTSEQVTAWQAEGEWISKALPREVVQEVFRTA